MYHNAINIIFPLNFEIFVRNRELIKQNWAKENWPREEMYVDCQFWQRSGLLVTNFVDGHFFHAYPLCVAKFSEISMITTFR